MSAIWLSAWNKCENNERKKTENWENWRKIMWKI
jgi:hypothetical protein